MRKWVSYFFNSGDIFCSMNDFSYSSYWSFFKLYGYLHKEFLYVTSDLKIDSYYIELLWFFRIKFSYFSYF